jgi:hypothetical protein
LRIVGSQHRFLAGFRDRPGVSGGKAMAGRGAAGSAPAPSRIAAVARAPERWPSGSAPAASAARRRAISARAETVTAKPSRLGPRFGGVQFQQHLALGHLVAIGHMERRRPCRFPAAAPP